MITSADRRHVSESHAQRAERQAKEADAATARAAHPFDVDLEKAAATAQTALDRLEAEALAAERAAVAAVAAFDEFPDAENASAELVTRKVAGKARRAVDAYASETDELRTRAARQKAVIDHAAHVAAMERSPFLASKERLRLRVSTIVSDLRSDIAALNTEHIAYREACRIAADLSSQTGLSRSYPVADVPTVVQEISDQLAAEMKGNHPQMAYPLALRVGEMSGGAQFISLQLITELSKDNK